MCSTSHELLPERTDLSLNCRFQASDIAIRMYFSGIVILSHTQLPNNSPAILYYFAERPRSTLVKIYTPSNAVSSHGKIGRWKRGKGGHDLSQFVTRGHCCRRRREEIWCIWFLQLHWKWQKGKAIEGGDGGRRCLVSIWHWRLPRVRQDPLN